jgi:hypothetical protein
MRGCSARAAIDGARPLGSVAAYRGRRGPGGGAGRPAGPDRGHRDRAAALPVGRGPGRARRGGAGGRPGRGQPEGRWGGWAAGQPPWTAPQLVIAQRLAAGGRPELLARHSICQISRAGGLRLAAKVRLSRSGCVVDGAGASEPGSRPHADGLACAVWPQLATFAVWSRSPRAGAKLSAADGSSCVVSGSLRAGIMLTPGRSCMLSGW